MIEEKISQPILVRNEISPHFEWIENGEDGYWLYPEYLQTTSPTRLVAIIPFGRINQLEVSRRIVHLAYSFRAQVLLLGLAPVAEYWYREHLKLDCIASAIQSIQTPSHVLCSNFSHWHPAIKEVFKNGDMFTCYAQQELKTLFLKKQTMGEWLLRTFHVPVFIMEHLELREYISF